MTLELLHREGPSTFKTDMDLKISPNGDIATFTGNAELIQSVNKSVVTKQLIDGYGTRIHELRGLKNQQTLQTLGILSIISNLQLLQAIQKQEVSLGRREENALIVSLSRVNVEKTNQSIKYKIDIIGKYIVYDTTKEPAVVEQTQSEIVDTLPEGSTGDYPLVDIDGFYITTVGGDIIFVK